MLSTSVIALASARRSPARTSAASDSIGTARLGADRGIRRGPLALADQLEHAAGGLRDRRPGSEEKLESAKALPPRYADQISYLRAVVLEGAKVEPLSSIETNVTVTEILDAARRSAAIGKRVELPANR